MAAGARSLESIAEAVRAVPAFSKSITIEAKDDLALAFASESLGLIVPADVVAGGVLGPYLKDLAEGRAGLVVLGERPGLLDLLPAAVVVSVVPEGAGAEAIALAIEGVTERVHLRQQHRRTSMSLDRYRYELSELIEIARAITQERNIVRLLDLILVKSRFITGADAGSIYVLEGDDPDPTKRTLRFKLSQNDSCQFESREFTMPVSTRSIAGYAVVTRQPINIPDVAHIDADAPYGYDARFDKRVGYKTRSMVSVPMISAEDEVIGVIQLINKKVVPARKLETPEDYEHNVMPFDARSIELLHSLASQAGIALENALLYEEIRTIFEGFVRASVQAIEQRDPTTSGHSLRVSVLSCRLAEVVDRVDSGVYAPVKFTPREIRELEYASLLHDFGKIGVREQVLVKAKKLYPHELDAVKRRIEIALRTAEVEAFRKRMSLMKEGAGESDLRRVDDELTARRVELEQALKLIVESNEPTVLSEGDFTRIADVGKIAYTDGDGCSHRLLNDDEVASLQVRRGSLNEPEIEEIRSHVVHTFNFLSQIPWGKSFAKIPEIAGAHHEKLDGTGYPEGKRSDQIPVPSKIMTIADIYDALTARDRPYKRAMPVERALDILGYEVKGGQVDGELVRIFTEAQIFKEVEKDLRY